MRNRSKFNQDWLFCPAQLSLDAPDEQFQAVTLPHTNKVFPHHNFDNREYQFISTYRKRFQFSAPDEDEQVLLEFDGVMLACTIYLNSQFIREHLGGFISFSVDITNALRDGENLLVVYVDSRERPDIPPYGHLVDYLTFGGIYRDVYLLQVRQTHIENIFVKPSNVLEHPRLNCDVRITNWNPGLTLMASLIDPSGQQIAEAHCLANCELSCLEFETLPDIELWALDHPNLYSIRFALIQDGFELDQTSSRFGFREARFDRDGRFYLNGQPLKLFGLDRHQTYPYIGAAASARLQHLDAEILKYELACNVVRTSHYPQSPHFLNRCDEIGLLVFEEITGWQHIGDEKWQEICLAELAAMIERDRNHPSVILWGVRINESPDHDPFYTRTNALTRRLDPTRQTGGVRCFRESSFLEDVFTYNDFSNTVVEPVAQPYLITEFAGHMFPTKVWDHEERLIEHALLHARIHNLQLGHENISGAIGWCAFDYATHIEFGSGDRICYHGVMDIFRLPKMAAFFYKSQLPPSQEVVLYAATRWTMGDRSGGGNNPLTIFSNCDEIDVFIGHIYVGRFQPNRASYPNLPHPPFTVYGLDQYSAWGQKQFFDLHIVGYLDGESAAEHWISSDRLPKKLEFSTHTDHIYADGADTARLAFRITDSYGNPLPFATTIVKFEIEGDADLIGENPYPLVGGQAAIFIKARHQPGKINLRAHAPGLPSVSLSLEILPLP